MAEKLSVPPAISAWQQQRSHGALGITLQQPQRWQRLMAAM